jgi:hypothetical protein
MEDPMPDQAYCHAQLPGRQAKARQLLADRAFGGGSTNNPRLIIDILLGIDDNGVVGSPSVRHRPQLKSMPTYLPSTRPDTVESP